MPTFVIDGQTYSAERMVDGILVNPDLPAAFGVEGLSGRSADGAAYRTTRPFIAVQRYKQPRDETLHLEASAAWERAWPQGLRFDVHCLTEGQEARLIVWGSYGTLEGALAAVRERYVADGQNEVWR